MTIHREAGRDHGEVRISVDMNVVGSVYRANCTSGSPPAYDATWTIVLTANDPVPIHRTHQVVRDRGTRGRHHHNSATAIIELHALRITTSGKAVGDTDTGRGLSGGSGAGAGKDQDVAVCRVSRLRVRNGITQAIVVSVDSSRASPSTALP